MGAFSIFKRLRESYLEKKIEKEKAWYFKGITFESSARYQKGSRCRGSLKKAIKCYKKAPHIAGARVGMANCYSELGDHIKAVRIRDEVDRLIREGKLIEFP